MPARMPHGYLIGVIMKLFYSPAYVAADYGFETTRKAQWIADSLAADPITGVELVEPQPLSVEALTGVHADKYVRAVRTGKPRQLAESNGFEWDPGIWTMAQATNGGAVAAALEALQNGVSGSLSAGLHHARRDHGAAFCTFNGLALAAFAALKAGAEDVLILDLDAHCGGGTHSLVSHDLRIRHLDISTCKFDGFENSKPQSVDDCSRLPRVPASDLRDSRGSCLSSTSASTTLAWTPSATISKATLAKREQLVFEWAHKTKTPIAFVLAGGYLVRGLDRDGLVGLHRLTIAAAATQRKE